MARDQWSSAGGKGANRSVLNSPTGATFSQANKDRKGLRMVSRGVQHGVSGAVSEGFPRVSSYVSRVSAHLDHKKHLCFLRLLVLKIRPSDPFIILKKEILKKDTRTPAADACGHVLQAKAPMKHLPHLFRLSPTRCMCSAGTQ